MLRADRFTLGASLVFGAAFAVMTPPFQVPDEPAHFYRAYNLSEGRLEAKSHDGKRGAWLPVSLRTLVWRIAEEITTHPERKLSAAAVIAAFNAELEAERREFLEFPTAAIYSPVPYVPQALAIAAGRLAGAPPLLLLYLGRGGNALAASLLIYLAVRQLTAYRWLFAALALTPMATFLRGSISADAVTTATAFLLAATTAKLAFRPGASASRRDVVLLILSSAALCLSKPAYVPLAFAPALVPRRAFPQGRRGPKLVCLLVTAAAFGVALATALSVEEAWRAHPRVDPQRQAQSALAEPVRFLHLAAADYVRHAPRYASQLVGRLGWLDVPLPLPLLVSYLALLLTLAFVDSGSDLRILSWQRAFLAGAAAMTLLVVSASQYALWTPYRADYVEGLQGRYFHPLAPFAVWIVHPRWSAGRVDARLTGWLAAVVCSVSSLGALAVLVLRSYL